MTYNQMLFNILKSNTIQNGYFTQHYINNMNTILPYGGTFKYRLTKIPVLFFLLSYYTKHDKLSSFTIWYTDTIKTMSQMCCYKSVNVKGRHFMNCNYFI